MAASRWSRPGASSSCAASADSQPPEGGRAQRIPPRLCAGEGPAECADEMAAGDARGAARLAAGEPRESSTLRGVGAGIDDYRENPVAVGHDLAGAQHEGEFAAAEGQPAEVSLIDAEDQHRRTMVVSHRPLRVRVNARAEIVAIAALHIFTA